MFFTINEIAQANRAIGHHWFDQQTIRFFRSIATGPVIANMFVSSERGPDNVRRYTIRKATDDGRIETVGEFQEYDTKAAALRAIRKISANQ